MSSRTNFQTGISVYGMPVLPFPTTGNVYFVNNSSVLAPDGVGASDGNDGLTPQRPFSTLATAITATTASRGDVIIVGPGHAETITSSLTPKAGSAILGLGWGAMRPTFTSSGAIDLVTISAANVRLQNIRLQGAASATALINIASGGTDLWCEDLEFIHTAAPTDAVTVAAAGNRMRFIRCFWRGTAAGPDVCISLEAADVGQDFYIKDAVAQYVQSTDLDEAFIQTAAFAAGQGGIVDGLSIIGFALTVMDFNSSAAARGEWLAANIRGGATADLTLANAMDMGGGASADVLLTDVATASGTRIPNATAA